MSPNNGTLLSSNPTTAGMAIFSVIWRHSKNFNMFRASILHASVACWLSQEEDTATHHTSNHYRTHFSHQQSSIHEDYSKREATRSRLSFPFSFAIIAKLLIFLNFHIKNLSYLLSNANNNPMSNRNQIDDIIHFPSRLSFHQSKQCFMNSL